MHPMLPLAPLLLTGALTAAAPAAAARPQVDPAPPTVESAALPDAVESARELARSVESARYTILRGDKKRGVYLQTNRIIEVDGQEMLEFKDIVKMPKAGDEFQARTAMRLVDGLPVRFFNAQTEADGMQLAFRNGKMTGTGLMRAPVNRDVSKSFVMDIALLRGLPRIPREAGAEAQLDYVDVDNLLTKKAVSTGVLRCVGPETIEIGDSKIETWKYRWKGEGKRPTSFWYDDIGRLIKREVRKETWILDLSESKKDGADAPKDGDAPSDS